MVRSAHEPHPRSQWSLTFEVRKRWAVSARAGMNDPTSQWSLTFEVRKRGVRGVEHGGGDVFVAMEPDL